MRTTTTFTAAALLVLVSACGGGAANPAAQAPAAPSTPAAPSAPATSAGGSSAAVSGPRVLLGTVGKPDQPEAFTIALADSSGEPVTTLPAGDYQVKVADLAKIHNFHLTGPGVEQSTTVPATGEVTWTVTLKPGSYTFICDPHPSMVGTVTVT